jgi:hypothetical protein
VTVRHRFEARAGTPVRAAALALAAAALLAACAQPGGLGGSSDDPCNPVVGAVIGGALGAITGDRNRGGRALVGAGLGALACMAINYSTRQTRSAQQVGDEYRAQNNNQLPPAPLVTAYRTQAERASAKGGEDITVTSTIEVVPGRSEPLKELREEFAIVDPNGVARSRLSKTPAPAGSSGGAYVSTLQFTFPQGVPAGAYQVQSRLFVNGKPAQTSALKIQVARAADGALLVARLR